MSEGRKGMQLAPIRKSVEVGVPPQEAFHRFTRGLGSWWPLETHSVGGAEAETVVFEGREGGKIVERMRGGGTAEWGTVLAYDAPKRVVFSWHPGRDEESAQEVEVRFIAVEGGTRVELVHRGWDVLGEAADELRSDYDGGWDYVLGRYSGGIAG